MIAECSSWLTGSVWEPDLEVLQVRFSVLSVLVQAQSLEYQPLIHRAERMKRRTAALAVA